MSLLFRSKRHRCWKLSLENGICRGQAWYKKLRGECPRLASLYPLLPTCNENALFQGRPNSWLCRRSEDSWCGVARPHLLTWNTSGCLLLRRAPGQGEEADSAKSIFAGSTKRVHHSSGTTADHPPPGLPWNTVQRENCLAGRREN